VVKALLEAYPANAMAQNTSGESPLHMSSYSASDDVQAALLAAAPESAALADAYGDTPLHFAARAGATFGLLQSMVHAAPHALQKANRRGVTPFWALPRSFLEAASLHEILRDDQEEQEEQEDNEESYEYRHDWDAMVLFLRYSYFGKERAAAMMAQEEEAASAAATKHEDVAWLVHAAASTPACPRQVLAFLCRMFPAQALQLDHQGHTPLQLAVRAPVLIEPTDWDEWEDGFGEQRDLPTGELQIESQVLSQSQVANPSADVDFLQQLQSTKSAESELESSAQENRAVVQILLEWSPKSVLVRDAQGRLPLTSALAAGQCFETVRTLIAAYPAALSESDPVTRLGHMEVAALHSPDLSSVYALIRALPTGVKGATRRRQTVSSTEAKAKRSHVASSLDGAATSDTKRRLLA
jgi:ankyrin repeat protein